MLKCQYFDAGVPLLCFTNANKTTTGTGLIMPHRPSLGKMLCMPLRDACLWAKTRRIHTGCMAEKQKESDDMFEDLQSETFDLKVH